MDGVRPNKDDVWSAGHICPKGATIGSLHEDPDRLRRPLVRRPGGSHVEVSWDDAFAEAERVLRPVLDSDGVRALTVYIGNPVAHNSDLATYVGSLLGFAQTAGMQGYYSPGTVDQWPLNVVSCLLFGAMWNSPIPDLYHTDHLMVLGANPAESQGSMLSAPDIMGLLTAIRQAAARSSSSIPAVPATARRATEWVPIRPGTDALLLFAILRTLGERGWVRKPAHLRDRVLGLDEVVALAAPFTPESVAPSFGISARRSAASPHDPARADNPVIYSRIGACAQEFGTLTTWLVFVINTALGALDRPGARYSRNQPVWVPMFAKPPDQDSDGYRFGRFHSRVRGAPEVLGLLPCRLPGRGDRHTGRRAHPCADHGGGQPCGLRAWRGPTVQGAWRPQRDGLRSMTGSTRPTRHADVILPGLPPWNNHTSDDLYWTHAIASRDDKDGVRPQSSWPPSGWELLLRLVGARSMARRSPMLTPHALTTSTRHAFWRSVAHCRTIP